MKLKPTVEPTEVHIIDHIIAFISVLLWPHQSSSNTSNAIPAQGQPDTGSTSTTGRPSSRVSNPQVSTSTMSTTNTVDQKKVDGGTKSGKRTKRTSSSVRSSASIDSSISPKTSTSTINHQLMTVEALPPFMPRSARDMPWTIPPSGLTIVRHN